MKALILLTSMAVSTSAFASCDEVFFKVGAGYKFNEQDTVILNGVDYSVDRSPYSARFETGLECGNLTFGVAHHSQWDTGWPANKTGEYYKNEFFIDYKFSWGL